MKNQHQALLTLILATAIFTLNTSAWSEWTVVDRENDALPGRIIEIDHDGTRVAGFVYGPQEEGQIKPYLSVYDEEGHRLTNPGIDSDGETRGRFPHHRGIFIGWNQVQSDLGSDDLWHLRGDERMELISIERKEATSDGARLDLLIHWLSSDRDDESNGLLVAERRTIEVTRMRGRTVVDHRSEMTAKRDLKLHGDLQHAGLHFRADAEVDEVRGDTKYLWSPAHLSPGGGRIVSDELNWVNFRYPLHGNWYSVTQLNRPENRSTELSWRDYGRFGFFFTDELSEGEVRTMTGRFLIERMEEKADDKAAIRRQADQEHSAYLGQ